MPTSLPPLAALLSLPPIGQASLGSFEGTVTCALTGGCQREPGGQSQGVESQGQGSLSVCVCVGVGGSDIGLGIPEGWGRELGPSRQLHYCQRLPQSLRPHPPEAPWGTCQLWLPAKLEALCLPYPPAGPSGDPLGCGVGKG